MRTLFGASYETVSPVGASIAQPCALPGLDLINEAVGFLKCQINDGRTFSFKTFICWVPYRILSYSGIPTALNTISLILSLALTILSLPISCCGTGKKINMWCWMHTKGSFANVIQCLFDITSDIRQLSCMCCCPRESVWRSI